MVPVKNNFAFYLWGALLFSFVLMANGVIPFFAIPAREQAIWALGFAKSLTHGSLFSIYAHDFGSPVPAAISFGLPAVLPMAWLLRLNITPELVYDLIFAAWYLVAFISSYKLSTFYRLPRMPALLCATLWSIFPMVVDHVGYGMLSLGMVLLPFYMLSVIHLFHQDSATLSGKVLACLLYAFAAIVAIFMDGYTFMIFAVMSSGYVFYKFLQDFSFRKLTVTGLSVYHVIVFAVAYYLYSSFIGKSNYTPSDMDFFRGWGVDISYLLIPTLNTSWFFDALHLSIPRSMKEHYGDNSVWVTTFILPLLLVLPMAIYLGMKKKINKIWLLYFFLFLVGLYFSLGPSLKFFSLKADSDSSAQLMPATAAWFATGNAFIYEHVPGINVMRATYRWLALSFFMLWLILLLVLTTLKSKKSVYLVLIALIVAFTPVLDRTLPSYHNQYKSFSSLNEFLLEPLAEDLQGASTIAYIPWSNDFFANYLTPMLGKKAYNIGGDKNLDAAWSHWPANMHALMHRLDENNAGYLIRMLSSGEADAIVIPFFNMIWYPGIVRNDEGKVVKLTGEAQAINWISNENRVVYRPIVEQLKKEKYLDVKENLLYAVVRLSNRGGEYPVSFATKDLKNYVITGEGWHIPEPDHIWSKARATINLPVDGATGSEHTVRINFSVFGASPSTPKTVRFSSPDNASYQKVVISQGGVHQLDYRFIKQDKISQLHVEVEEAISPRALNMADDRILGISLTGLEQLN